MTGERGETADSQDTKSKEKVCKVQKGGKEKFAVFSIIYILHLIPGLGEDFAGAERVLEEGVRVEETFPFATPLWLPVLLFPEPDLWEASVTW